MKKETAVEVIGWSIVGVIVTVVASVAAAAIALVIIAVKLGGS